MNISRIRNALLWRFVNKSFPWLQQMGLHVTPVHFYQPVPDTRTLTEATWQRRSELIGISLNEAQQNDMLARFSARYKSEYEKFPRDRTPVPHEYYISNGGFESVDAEMLYCMIRHFKPKKIFEIGSGNSTYLSAQAILKNREDGHECQLTAFEPHPNETLTAGFPGLAELVTSKIQDVPLSKFGELGEGDFLFIDSSHVLKIGSDVQYEYLEILPRLARGTIVHVHDIFLPAEYHKEWVLKNRTFWNEQYLLQAFLAFNESFEVLWAGSHMHLSHPDKLEAAFSSYRRNGSWPGSFWLRRVN